MADHTDILIENKVNKYIDDARHSGTLEGVKIVASAFRSIQADRQAMCLSDEVTSSAEHYLCARYMAAKFTGAGVALLSLGYDAVKVATSSGTVQSIGLGNECPASEWTPRQTAWKLFGSVHGSHDLTLPFRRINPINSRYLETAIVTGIGGD